MARQVNQLNARTVANIKTPGRHADGGNLYLVVEKSGSKRWMLLYRFGEKRREMGLGGLNSVPLARARELAADARAKLADGVDPLVRAAEERRIPTFGEAADALIASMSSSWRNEKHRDQWVMTLAEYCKPMRPKPVNEITTEDVLKVLKPIWLTKAETASRLRGRIERVLDGAKAMGHRSGENPALWRGHLKMLLPARQKLQRGHHAAMPYDAVPAFIEALRAHQTATALALEFTILTASRSGEAMGARWSEIDTAAKVWIVPPARMKAGREHRVPLADRAVQILAEVGVLRVDDAPTAFVFPGRRRGRSISNMAFDMLLRRMKLDVTAHGFRSSFRDWAGEATHFPREIAEAALAHVVGDQTERAYRRGDALEKRRALMQAWADFLTAAPAENVVALRRG